MRRVTMLCLAVVLAAGCGDEKKPDPLPPVPEPDLKKLPPDKKAGPGFSFFPVPDALARLS